MGGGWTVIQRRIDGNTNFLLDLTAYEYPFGNPSKNYWVGNRIIRSLTQAAEYELLVEMQQNAKYAFALYDLFYTKGSSNKLYVSSYQSCSNAGDSFTQLAGQSFITDSCGVGAWWFKYGSICEPLHSSLNAPYTPPSCKKGIFWNTFSGSCVNLEWTSMKIRRKGVHGYYLTAPNYFCDATDIDVVEGVATDVECQELCTEYTGAGSPCVTATFNRTGVCYLKGQYCAPSGPNQGNVDSDFDTFFRLDKCDWFSSCGPPPTMYATTAFISDMPNSMTVNYTCRPGFTNAAWSGDTTTLVCDSGHWTGDWLACDSLCGDYPSMPNTVLTGTSVEAGVITLIYACAPEFELISGMLTRSCINKKWIGDPVNCSTTRCNPPPIISRAWADFQKPITISDRTKRYSVWNYTCDIGYIFEETLTKSNTIKCTELRTWSPVIPGTCVRKLTV